MIQIKATEIKIVPISELKPKKGNRNRHPESQLDELVKQYRYQGMRNPVTVSNQSGEIVCGNGRYFAAIRAGLTELPVIYQDYDSAAQEYEHHVADNGIGLQSELDITGIREDLENIDLDIRIENLGVVELVLPDVVEVDLPELPNGEKSELEQITFTLTSIQASEVKNALRVAKDLGEFGETGNENSNGNALSRVCEWFVANGS